MAYQLSNFAQSDINALGLSEHEAAVAARLLSRLLRIPPRQTTAEELDLFDLACRIYVGRRERRHFFPDGLFTDPAWDMLLILYCAEGKHEPMGVSAVCYSADVPHTTSLRWLSSLTELGLAVKKPNPDDGRSNLVQLTEAGRRAMNDYLCRLFDRHLFLLEKR